MSLAYPAAMRIAWTGESGGPQAGGVKGIAYLMLDGLARRGHEIEVFASTAAGAELTGLPPTATARLASVRWNWERWYTRGPLRLFLSSSVMRIVLQRRLARLVEVRHREEPFDVIFQMSQLESFFRRDALADVPLVVHPCTIARLEWEWHRAERDLAGRAGAGRRHRLVAALLWARAALQRGHAGKPELIVGPSRIFLADLQRVFGLPAARTAVLRHPVDLARMAPPAADRLEEGPWRLLFVSRMSSRKGVELVVELSHRLDDLAEEVQIELIGGATLWSDYTPLLQALNPRVATYRGEVPHAEVERLLRDSAALLVPSRFEPGSIVTGEALAVGLPVIASSAVGPSDVLTGAAGRVFADGDADAFEARTRELIDEFRGAPAAARAAARATAERHFDGSAIVERLETILGSVVTPPVQRGEGTQRSPARTVVPAGTSAAT